MLRQLAMACALALVALPAYAQGPQAGVERGMTLELGGGFDYTQFNAAGWPNDYGYYGSFGLNIFSWLQVYVDGDQQFGSVPNGNTRLYADHGGARFYYRPRYWMIHPFGEALFGVSRLDLNLNQAGQKFSENGFSFRLGGGTDVKISRHWSVRAFEADYYRTPFLQTHQNNLWLSAGIVFKFGEHQYPR
ncbi:MAG TPA: outer membrane beta-barrel protein [Candidatus Acidoferrales bacterium]|nr:outer membrane beta-barrel protein [Candidatus Acidoferrales bacterium]